MQQIIVDVSLEGEVTVNTEGFTGVDCDAATRFFGTALGLVQQQRRKPEFHRRNRTSNQQRLGQ